MDFSSPMHDAMPAYWNSYFRVTDCDAATVAAEAQGGSLLMAPHDTPFGRMASVRDPDGAVFSLVQNNPA